MSDFLKNNLASILTFVGVVLAQYIAYRMGKIKDDSDRTKTTTDAERDMREDLQAQLDKAELRIEKKDATIVELYTDNSIWRKKALEAELQLARVTYEKELLQKKLDEYERKVFYISTATEQKSGE